MRRPTRSREFYLPAYSCPGLDRILTCCQDIEENTANHRILNDIEEIREKVEEIREINAELRDTAIQYAREADKYEDKAEELSQQLEETPHD